jgi:hypothetical protein
MADLLLKSLGRREAEGYARRAVEAYRGVPAESAYWRQVLEHVQASR